MVGIEFCVSIVFHHYQFIIMIGFMGPVYLKCFWLIEATAIKMKYNENGNR